jgi:hypothetical protein
MSSIAFMTLLILVVFACAFAVSEWIARMVAGTGPASRRWRTLAARRRVKDRMERESLDAE